MSAKPLITRGRLLGGAVLFSILGTIGFASYTVLYVTENIFDLLKENERLKQSITNLTQEDIIGYAKVLSQEEESGRLVTRLRFVETDRADKTKRILSKEYEVEGDIIHFDALVVKFGNQYVADGRERALYLWRRIYGEYMTPESGFPIETEGQEPKRYEDLCAKLSLEDRETFWREIWQLSNDPQRLNELGVRAVNGKVTYTQLRPGLIYVFRITATGDLYAETVHDL